MHGLNLGDNCYSVQEIVFVLNGKFGGLSASINIGKVNFVRCPI